MSPNRIVAVLTPLVFAPAAGAIAAWIANNIPGAEISARNLEEVFIGGALIGLAPAAQWLHGWQKYETRKAEQENAVELANAPSGVAGAGIAPEPADEDEDFEPTEAEGFEPTEAEGFEDEDFDEVEDLETLDEELFADEQLAERS
jgi:hypothetical protein